MLSTMDIAVGLFAYIGALSLTAIASILLALFVVLRARAVPGSTLLAVFLLGVALWSVAQVLPAILGPAARPVTTTLIALSPLPAAGFIHLAFAFALCGALRPVAIAAYATAALMTLIGLIFGVGKVVPWHDFPGMFVPSTIGWCALAVAAILSIAGHLRLAQTWREQDGQHRRQAGAVFVSSLIGLVALTGFAFPALGIDAYPWPVLLLPLYSVALVYGIVRHRFMAADVWARRGLVWLLLVAGAGAASALIASLPLALAGRPAGLFATWAALAATLALGLAILAPLKRMADRIVFPGGRISEADLAEWRDQLAEPTDEAALGETARSLLRQRLSLPADGPTLSVDGETVSLTGWDDAPIATRHVAERFAGLVTESARRLTVARQMVEAEREARLAELGTLAATVAHDLRNPLGIVQMAATGAPPEIRSEIGEQVARMNHLVTDILDYARAWTIVPQPLIVADLVAFLRVEAHVPDSLMVTADRHALLRALTNLVDNARALGTRVALVAEVGPPVTIDICDDGPGIAPEISDSLFRPFVSRRPGGTGLGLAIVRRIMEAHGGTVTLAERPGWSTCFRLTFGASR
ncbi:signal transduction histidine kinase [Sphingomonas sp. SORGH_AS 950]|uniref:sensor histidine kinase n=1 Tax=Sphingomonas sp. SORGH_AS_0950 TaxID=3041792 RepID=UPI00278A502B|nr:sensor histidine kinase [Sphingomonas sp. SORGH_AS_0950]MDQ1156408.1 signal transduction histidine kinase [Sphingomonas sp. SORGH_AS_0950]